jgi:hypothetical protein
MKNSLPHTVVISQHEIGNMIKNEISMLRTFYGINKKLIIRK